MASTSRESSNGAPKKCANDTSKKCAGTMWSWSACRIHCADLPLPRWPTYSKEGTWVCARGGDDADEVAALTRDGSARAVMDESTGSSTLLGSAVHACARAVSERDVALDTADELPVDAPSLSNTRNPSASRLTSALNVLRPSVDLPVPARPVSAPGIQYCDARSSNALARARATGEAGATDSALPVVAGGFGCSLDDDGGASDGADEAVDCASCACSTWRCSAGLSR